MAGRKEGRKGGKGKQRRRQAEDKTTRRTSIQLSHLFGQVGVTGVEKPVFGVCAGVIFKARLTKATTVEAAAAEQYNLASQTGELYHRQQFNLHFVIHIYHRQPRQRQEQQ